MTDKEKIILLLDELASPEKIGSFFMNNATFDFSLIRANSYSISAKGFKKNDEYW